MREVRAKLGATVEVQRIVATWATMLLTTYSN